MSAISSFALDCARAGRWVRGLMALEGSLNSTDASTRQACVAVAQVAASHNWAAALSLLHPTDAVQHGQAVFKTVDTVARHPDLSIEHYERVVEAMLRALGKVDQNAGTDVVSSSHNMSQETSSKSATHALSSSFTSTSPLTCSLAANAVLQRRVFLSATQWCTWETACRLLTALPIPPPQVCVERVHALKVLRHCVLHDVGPFAGWRSLDAQRTSKTSYASSQHVQGNKAKGRQVMQASRSLPQSKADTATPPPPSITFGESLSEKLRLLETAPAGAQHRRYTARDRREMARLKELRRQSLLKRAVAAELALQREAANAVTPSATSICSALRAITRPRSVGNTTPDEHDVYIDPAALFSLVESSRLTPELALLYARAVGLLCPERWATALWVLRRVETRPNGNNNGSRTGALEKQVRLWLMSRGSWSAALQGLRQWSAESASPPSTFKSVSDEENSLQIAFDTVRRTALPAHLLYCLRPQHTRPWYRLHVGNTGSNAIRKRDNGGAAAALCDPKGSNSTTVSRQIARALARGVRIDEIQLSAAGKQWAELGRWENALQLYYRFPLREFQKYAARGLVKARPALSFKALRSAETRKSNDGKTSTEKPKTSGSEDNFDVMAALQLLVPAGGIRYSEDAPSHPNLPVDTFPACLLVGAASDWRSALAVFRGCIRSGTRCRPQLLSSLLHHTDFPPQELCQVLTNYPAALNAGVRRRAKESFGVELP